MYGSKIITGIPSRQFYCCRKAYIWLKQRMNKGDKIFYKVSPDSCRLIPIYKVTFKGNSLFAVTLRYHTPLEGYTLVAKDSKGVKDTFTWDGRPYRYKRAVSYDCIRDKKQWIEDRIGKGRLHCFPETSLSPFIIRNISEDRNGIYSEDGTTRVYLNVFYIYFEGKDGRDELHTNW